MPALSCPPTCSRPSSTLTRRRKFWCCAISSRPERGNDISAQGNALGNSLPRAYTADSEDEAPSSKTGDAASRGSGRDGLRSTRLRLLV